MNHSSVGKTTSFCRVRSGYSLVEMLVAIAIASLVMSAVAVAMQTLHRVDRQLQDHAVYDQLIPRLSLQLRSDAHGAGQAALLAPGENSGGVVLTMMAEGDVVEYQSQAGRVTRTRRREQQELGREVYDFGQSTNVTWDLRSSDTPLLELKLIRALGRVNSEDARQVDRLVVAVGLRLPRNQEGASDAE